MPKPTFSVLSARSSTRLKASPLTTPVKREAPSPTALAPSPSTSRKRRTPKRVKNEDTSPRPFSGSLTPLTPEPGTTDLKPDPEDELRPLSSGDTDHLSPKKETTSPKTTLKDRKAALHSKYSSGSPFPACARPTADECHLAHSILVHLHGPRDRPKQVIASTTRAGCGDSPSVLDALVRTILSQNTSDGNSTRAKLSMDKAYGGSDSWSAIVAGGQDRLEEAIRCGGLSKVKSRVILGILDQAKDKYGEYSLDHLQQASTEEAMAELLGFDGVGPKTASCVLLFCLQREDFAVDTHVHRITGLLGWRPKSANREQTYHHLNKRVPDELKYALHILIVTHGKRCDECKAGGRVAGKCTLRKAFRDVVRREDGADGKGNEVGVDVVKREGGLVGETEAEVKEEV